MMFQIADGSITSNSRSLWDVTTELVPAIKMLKTPPFPQGRVALLRIRERSGSFEKWQLRGQLQGAPWCGLAWSPAVCGRVLGAGVLAPRGSGPPVFPRQG